MNRYGPMLISLVIMGLYAAHMMGYGIAWTEGDMKLMDMCLTLTIGYWLGSSHGSAQKQEDNQK